MRVHIDQDRCQGHGRCYAVAPQVIEADEIGNGREIGDGAVPAGLEDTVRKAAANCPESAVIVEEGD
jgi:ferredoxin